VVCRGGVTVILVAHRLSTVINADKILGLFFFFLHLDLDIWIIVMEDGRIVEEGNHQELIEKDEIYASLVKHQLTT